MHQCIDYTYCLDCPYDDSTKYENKWNFRLNLIPPTPLHQVTKHGLRGHIKEPVGTHGLLKAAFSAPIKQNDTVMLILYKRVYPKLPLEMTSHNISSSSLTTPSGCRHLVVV